MHSEGHRQIVEGCRSEQVLADVENFIVDGQPKNAICWCLYGDKLVPNDSCSLVELRMVQKRVYK